MLTVDVTDRDIRHGDDRQAFLSLVDDFLHDEAAVSNELPLRDDPAPETT